MNFSIAFLLSIYLVCCANAVIHNIWIPAGKHVAIPCKFKDLKSEDARWWENPETELTWSASPVALSVWYNEVGELVHIGEFLQVYLPPFENSELSLTQYQPKPLNSKYKKLNITPEFKSWSNGVRQLLRVKHLDSITCSQVQNKALHGVADNWIFTKRQSSVLNNTHFQFHVYAQPITIWNYAISPNIMNPNQSPLTKLAKKWCHSLHVFKWSLGRNICQQVYHQRLPLIKLSGPMDPLPLVSSSEFGYAELTVIIELSQFPATLIVNPTDNGLGRIHAFLKDSLDQEFVGLLKSMKKSRKYNMTMSTQVRAICPPGSHSIIPAPFLDGLTVNTTSDYNNNPLVDWPIVCHPCPDGQAPRIGYSFDGCHKCPRGYYLGSTGWPSSAACLPCPEGFTTETSGATTFNQCQVDAGTITKWLFNRLVDLWEQTRRAITSDSAKAFQTRTLSYSQKTSWSWLGRTDWRWWVIGSLYVLLILWLFTLSIFRLHLYAKMKALHRKQYSLLLKATLVGQINLLTRIKQRARHQIKHNIFLPEARTSDLPKNFSMERVKQMHGT